MKSVKNQPDLTEILRRHQDEIFSTINCIKIGTIESFNTAEQTATIRISIKQIVSEDDQGVKTYQEIPVLAQCPVMIITGGDSHLTMPVAVGDTCIVLFNDRDIDNWFVDGGVLAPNTTRKHDLSDGLAIVGIRNLQNIIADYLVEGVRLRFDSACQIDLITNAINSLAALWTHTGAFRGTANVRGASLTADNGATGTFHIVTVKDGIVLGGS